LSQAVAVVRALQTVLAKALVVLVVFDALLTRLVAVAH
jgi:hypothetical protein